MLPSEPPTHVRAGSKCGPTYGAMGGALDQGALSFAVLAVLAVFAIALSCRAARGSPRRPPPARNPSDSAPVPTRVSGRNPGSFWAAGTARPPHSRPRPVPRLEVAGPAVAAVRTAKNELRLDALTDTTADCTRRANVWLPPRTDVRPSPYSRGPTLDGHLGRLAPEALGSRARNVLVDARPVAGGL